MKKNVHSLYPHYNVDFSTYMVQHCKIISSWVEFMFVLWKDFYPLEDAQTSMIAWLSLTELKGKMFNLILKNIRIKL